MKKRFKNLGLRWKLSLGFGSILTFLLVVSWCAIANMIELRSSLHQLSDESLAASGQLGEFTEALSMTRIIQMRVAHLPPGEAEKAAVRGVAAEKQADESLAAYKKILRDPVNTKYLAEMTEAWDAYKQVSEAKMPILLAEDKRLAFSVLENDIGSIFRDRIRPLMDKMGARNVAYSAEVTKAADGVADRAIRTVLLMTSFALAVGALFGLFITRSITAPVQAIANRMRSLREESMRELSSGLSAFALGDLSAPVSHTVSLVPDVSEDEVGRMAATFNETLDMIDQSVVAYNKARHSLSAMVKQLSANSRSVADTSEVLASSSEQSGTASSEIAQGSEKLAVAASEAVEIMDQLLQRAGSVQHSSENQKELVSEAALVLSQAGEGIGGVAAASQSMAAAAHEGFDSVAEIVSAMEIVRARAEHSSEKVRELDEKGKAIGRIVQSIEAIAEQTNLLALNAAIEAARAGEHGRGFAVVADEVRKLAEKAALATKEITLLVESVTVTVDETVEAIAGTTAGVMEGAVKSEQAGRSLTNILDSASEVAARAEEVAALTSHANETMSRVSQSATDNVESAKQMVDDANLVSGCMSNVASVSEESAAGAEELSASVEEVGGAAIELKRMSNDLMGLVEQFKIDGDPKSTLRIAA